MNLGRFTKRDRHVVDAKNFMMPEKKLRFSQLKTPIKIRFFLVSTNKRSSGDW